MCIPSAYDDLLNYLKAVVYIQTDQLKCDSIIIDRKKYIDDSAFEQECVSPCYLLTKMSSYTLCINPFKNILILAYYLCLI